MKRGIIHRIPGDPVVIVDILGELTPLWMIPCGTPALQMQREKERRKEKKRREETKKGKMETNTVSLQEVQPKRHGHI